MSLYPYVALKPRFKDQDESDHSNVMQLAHTENGVSKGIASSTTCASVISQKQMTGYNHDHFHRRVKQGELLCKTPFEQFECEGYITGKYDLTYTAPNYIYHIWHSSGKYTQSGWFLTRAQIQSAYAPALDFSLVQAAAAKIMGESHDTLTFLSELGSVKAMFGNLVRRCVRFKDLPRNMPDVASLWLEYRYGWRTFLMDLVDLSDALQTLSVQRRRRFSKSAKSLDKYSETSSILSSDLSGTFKNDTRVDVTVSLKGSVTADIVIPPFQFDPVQTAWELVPYSFVVDWLIGVGQALAALTFLSMQTKYEASIGYRVDVEKTVQRSIVSLNAGYSGKVERLSVCKGSLTYRYPCFVPKSPSIKIKINVLKIYDLLAMLIQRKTR